MAQDLMHEIFLRAREEEEAERQLRLPNGADRAAMPLGRNVNRFVGGVKSAVEGLRSRHEAGMQEINAKRGPADENEARRIIDGLIARIQGAVPQGVKDFEPLTFIQTGQTKGLEMSPSLGQIAGTMFPQSADELPLEFLPFDDVLRHAPDAFKAIIHAFHGTSDKAAAIIRKKGFLKDFLRTGTGGQAQGAGYYFAQAEGVGKHYKQIVGGHDDMKRAFLDAIPEDADFDEVVDLFGTGTFSEKQEKFLKALEAEDWLGFDYPSQAISAAFRPNAADSFEFSDDLVRAIQDQGELLKIKLDVEPEDLLDWDKPLSEQPWILDEPADDIIARVKSEGRDPTLVEIESVNVQRSRAGSGSRGDPTGRTLYHDLAQRLGSNEAAASALREAGIPGVRYLDQASRATDIAGRTSGGWKVTFDNGKTAVMQNRPTVGGGIVSVEPNDAVTHNIVIFPGGEDLIEVID